MFNMGFGILLVIAGFYLYGWTLRNTHRMLQTVGLSYVLLAVALLVLGLAFFGKGAFPCHELC